MDMPGFDRIRRLLRQDWDPLGIAGEPQAADEYDDHALQVFRMVQERRAAADIAGYLDEAWQGLSGTPPTAEARMRTAVVVGRMMAEIAE